MSQVLALECTWLLKKDAKCRNKARESGFCGKHEPRALLLEQAKKDGRRLCDDGKRACKNYTEVNKLKCEECLEKNREKDNKKYEERKTTLNMCLGCGITIPELLDGILGHKVQRCQECYTKLREVEANRNRTRNYAAENMANLDKHYTNYVKGAGIRNMAFEISIDTFKEMVKLPCYYCNSYNENEVIGLDRINSAIHYTIANCVPCCQVCNYMKGDLSKHDFIRHVHRIATHYEQSEDSEYDIEESTRVSSMIPPKKVAELYKYGKFDEFIQACEKDNRHPFFIERLKTINRNMTNIEFKQWFRTCCRADAKYMASKENIKSKHVSQKEIYALLNTKSVKIAIDTYVAVHGDMPGFKDEIQDLSRRWETLTFDERTLEIKKIMVKYRNVRAYSVLKGDITDKLNKEPSKSPQDVQASPAKCSMVCKPPMEEASLIQPVQVTKPSQPPAESSHDQNIIVVKPESSPTLHSTLYPTQWKISNIYRALVTENTKSYLSYLQENNPQPDLEAKLASLSAAVKNLAKEGGELLIKTFIEDLRTARHNAHCYSKNDALLLREDREHWNSQSVLRAFNANMLDKFKHDTEAKTGESADDPIWSKRWTTFVTSVSNETDLTKKKTLISNFLTAQRTKKYRKLRATTIIS